jgi:hypothetical protein
LLAYNAAHADEAVLVDDFDAWVEAMLANGA